jgi:hypothetical protein
MERIELHKQAQRRKHKALWPDEKRGKNEKKDFVFGKREKINFIFYFFCYDFPKPLASIKKPIFWLFIFGLFFCKLFFCFQKELEFFFIVCALSKRLINVGHDFQKIPMTMKISHGRICIFAMGVI